MIDSTFSAVLWGAAFGSANGWASRYALRKTLTAPHAVYLSVFTAGFLWRLLFLVGSVWCLHTKKYIIVLPYCAALIFTQFIFEVIPLRKDGT